MVGRLGRGPASVGELTAPFDMALPSFMKHMRMLEESGLIRTSKTGRVRTCTIDTQRVSAVGGWLDEQRRSGRAAPTGTNASLPKARTTHDTRSATGRWGSGRKPQRLLRFLTHYRELVLPVPIVVVFR